jgi:branched-chain amino acid aminotransferase/4-amino-4-deoxychorismate lyase
MIAHDAIPFDDRGLLLGEGLFETLLALDGEIRHLDAHLDRMAGAGAVLGLPFDRAEAEGLCRRMIPATGRVALRLTLTGGSGGRGLDRPADLTPRLFARVAAVARRPLGSRPCPMSTACWPGPRPSPPEPTKRSC